MGLTARERGFGDCRRPDFRAKNIVSVKAGGVKVNVHKDLDLTFLCFLTELESLHGKGSLARDADDWGWHFRPIRDYERKYEATKDERYLSNHSWGTAVDVDAVTNRLGQTTTTFKVAETRALCFKYGLSWGFDYRGRKDPMHFEFLGTNYDARRRKMELARALRAFAKAA